MNNVTQGVGEFEMQWDDLPFGVIIHRQRDGVILKLNREVKKILQLKASRKALTIVDLWHQDPPEFPKNLNSTKQGPFYYTSPVSGKPIPIFIQRQVKTLEGAKCFIDYVELAPTTTESQHALERTNSSLSETLVFGKMGSVELDLTTLELTVSKELLQLLDVDSESERSMSLQHFVDTYIHPEFRAVIPEKVEEGLEAMSHIKSEVNLAFEMLSAKGRKIRMEGKAIFKDTITFGILQDVTLRKNAEEQIAAEHHLSNTIINSLPGIFYLFDDQGKFLRWNKNFEFVSGYSSEEISNMIPLDFFDDDEKPIVMERIAKVFEVGTTEVEVNFMTKSRIKIPFYFNGSQIFFEGKRCLIGMGVDISARKEAERQSMSKARVIADLSQRVVTLADNIPDGIIFEYLHQPDGTGRFTYVSQGVESLFERTAEELTRSSNNGFDFIHREDLPQLQEALETSRQTMKGLELDYRVIVPSGKVKWIKSKATPHRVKNEGTLFIGILLDVTRQKYLEEEEAANRNKLQNTLDNIISGVVVVSPERKVTYANKSALEVLKISTGEVMNQYFQRALSVALNNRQTARNVLNGITNQDGSTQWLSVNAAPLMDQDGYFYGAVASFIDITESRLASINLEKSENELRAIIDAATHSTVLLDKHGIIQNFNAYAAEIAHTILTQTLNRGDHFTALIPTRFQDDFSTNFGRALRGEKVLVEREIVSLTGQKRWFEFLYLPVFNKKMDVIGVSFNATDLTQKKEAEAQYRKSTEQMRFAARLAKFGEWEMDLTTKILRWSDEVCRIHDIAPGGAIGLEEAIEFYTEESKPFIVNAVQRCIEQGDWYDLTLQIITRLGRKKWIRTVGVSERINNRAVRLHGLMQDIDDVKQKQEESARLAIIAKETNNLVIITGPDRTIQWVNESFVRSTGYELADVVGKSPGEILQGAETDDATVRMVREKLTRKEPVKFEIVNYKKSGEKYWVDVEIQPVFGSSGDLDYFIGIQSNITERKLAEDTQRESEQRFQIMADSAPVMIWMSGADKLWFYFNKGWFDFTGRPIVEERGNGWIRGVHPDDLDHCLDVYNTHFDQRKEFVMEYRLRNSGGEYRWIVNNGIPRFLADGQFMGYIGSCFDIHDRKRVEEDLRLTQSGLQQTLKEKEMMIKEIHHRVKNNLQLISSILYLKMGGMYQSEVKDFLEDTRRKIRSIALIHERLLQTGSMNQVDIADYLSKLILDIQMTHISQTLKLNIDARIEPTKISLDTAINCGLILNELITNAIKHAFADCSEGTVFVSFNKINGHFEFTVADDGSGLPESISPGKGGFGMQMLDVFLKQLKATIEIDRSEGTKYSIRFKS